MKNRISENVFEIASVVFFGCGTQFAVTRSG